MIYFNSKQVPIPNYIYANKLEKQLYENMQVIIDNNLTLRQQIELNSILIKRFRARNDKMGRNGQG